MGRAPVPANEHHDNLAGSRHPGGTEPYSVATPEVRKVARRLIGDEDYLEKLQVRLREGTAGAIEIWLWRWAHGNPPDATSPNAERDNQRYGDLRAIVLALIKENPRVAHALEDSVLAYPGLPPSPLPHPAPEPEAGDG